MTRDPCDHPGCDNPATTMIKDGIAYGLYCTTHGHTAETHRRDRIGAVNRASLRQRAERRELVEWTIQARKSLPDGAWGEWEDDPICSYQFKDVSRDWADIDAILDARTRRERDSSHHLYEHRWVRRDVSVPVPVGGTWR